LQGGSFFFASSKIQQDFLAFAIGNNQKHNFLLSERKKTRYLINDVSI